MFRCWASLFLALFYWFLLYYHNSEKRGGNAGCCCPLLARSINYASRSSTQHTKNWYNISSYMRTEANNTAVPRVTRNFLYAVIVDVMSAWLMLRGPACDCLWSPASATSGLTALPLCTAFMFPRSLSLFVDNGVQEKKKRGKSILMVFFGAVSTADVLPHEQLWDMYN